MSRLASHHLDRSPCSSSYTKTCSRDLRRSWSCLTIRVLKECRMKSSTRRMGKCCVPNTHAEDIMLLEARADLRELERTVFTELRRNMRQLMLCDNLGLTLAIERCRSRSYKILMVIRRIAGLCLARNIRLSIRWLDSETNPADESSRFFESGSHCCCWGPWNVVLVGFHISVFSKKGG